MTEVVFGGKFTEPICLAMGFFDCVHAGHREVLKEVIKQAERLHALPAVFTFSNNPFTSLGEKRKIIYTYAERLSRLAEEGIKVVISAEFNHDFADLSPQQFWKILTNNLYIQGIVTGCDYRFGHQAKGDLNRLGRYAKKWKMEVVTVPTLELNGEKVSSTRIRQLLAYGDIERANQLLVAPYRQKGTVIKGNAVGRQMNICTANFYLSPDKLELGEGVYAGTTEVEGRQFRSVTNVGTRPTVDGGDYRIETHIIGLNEDIYGKNICVTYTKRLRDIHKFDSLDELKQQILSDINRARGN